MLVVTLLLAAVPALAAEGLLPLDSRWDHPHFLTWRPANGAVSDANPPRFSWPATPAVVPAREPPAAGEFRLQLSRGGDFARPDHDFRTPYNFFNALPALSAGQWHWRVGYFPGTKAECWSAIRTFEIGPESVAWDRTLIDHAATTLAAKPRPRLGPPAGDWAAWRQQLEAGTETKGWLDDLLRRARGIPRTAWWKSFPQSDRQEQTELDERAFTAIALDLATASLAWKLLGDAQFAPVKDHWLALARLPKGGLSSPEYHGQGGTKWPTQITEALALGYDWLHASLTPAERDTLRQSIEWRLRAVYLEKSSWRSGERLAASGLALFGQSHPYENFMWSLPAVLLMAGELPLADELTPLCLNYLTGVTSAHGPDEGWNEGLCYGTWKGQTLMQATMHAALLLPELNVGRNPFYTRLGAWYAHLLPLGIQRLSFGDYAATPDRALSPQRNVFRWLSWLTGNGQCETRRSALVALEGNQLSARPWLDLIGATHFPYPAPQAEPARAVFTEAGWIMLSSQPPSDRTRFNEAVGLMLQCRSRGGFSHSYRAENDFVWHSFGQTLSAGGGGTAYPDPHSRHSLSHNVVLINGVGQEWNPRAPAEPLCGRLLVWHEGPGYVHCVGDATRAYQTAPGLLRWHRHVVFVDDRWFVILDDLAMRDEAPPASFSWLFHVAPQVEVRMDTGRPAARYAVGNVQAQVRFNKAADELDMVNLQGREGFKNPVTGQDLYAATAKALGAKNRPLRDEQIMAHNLWITNRRPAREWTLMTVLLARPDGEPEPEITFPDAATVRVRFADGRARSVTFDPRQAADIRVDLDQVRRHALATDPTRIGVAGPEADVRVGADTYRVRWLAQETFDRADWVNRWFVEGNSAVGARDGKLWVRRTDVSKANTATIWYRPELPQNVLVRFRAQAVPPATNNAANLNLFLHAREPDGQPLRFGRSGDYSEYHRIPNYIATFVGGYRPGWSRLRRDPGFHLVHEAEVRSEIGHEYEITITLLDGRLRYYLDGRRLHDVRDAEPLPAGRFGLRTWSTDAWWADVQIGALIE